jgi:hypothetical protein
VCRKLLLLHVARRAMRGCIAEGCWCCGFTAARAAFLTIAAAAAACCPHIKQVSERLLLLLLLLLLLRSSRVPSLGAASCSGTMCQPAMLF